MLTRCSPSSMQGLCSSKTRVWMSGQGCWPSFGSHPSWQDSHMCKSCRKNIADSVNDLPRVQWHHRDHPLWDFPHLSHNIWTHTMESKATLKKKRKRNHKIAARRAGERTREMLDKQTGLSSRQPTLLVVLFVRGLCLLKSRPRSSAHFHCYSISDLGRAETGRC